MYVFDDYINIYIAYKYRKLRSNVFLIASDYYDLVLYVNRLLPLQITYLFCELTDNIAVRAT